MKKKKKKKERKKKSFREDKKGGRVGTVWSGYGNQFTVYFLGNHANKQCL